MDMSLAELDQLILKSGFEYQAKWSREREDFKFKDLNVSIDKNAGYGYLAEFEKVIADPTEADAVKQLIRSIMLELEVDELMQDRLERMFAHYNQNWQDYYGTDKTFTIE
jgi:adenylate cyclase class IV